MKQYERKAWIVVEAETETDANESLAYIEGEIDNLLTSDVQVSATFSYEDTPAEEV